MIIPYSLFNNTLYKTLVNGLVGYWNMSSPNDNFGPNHGTLIGAATTAGILGNCYQFDGIDDTIYLLEPPPAVVNLSVGTINVWIKTAGAGAGYSGIVIKAGAYGLFLYNNCPAIFDWGTITLKDSGISVNDNTWKMITLVFNSGVTNGTKIYINGSLVFTTTMTVDNQLEGLVISGGSNPPSAQYFTGLIDEIGLWGRALSGTDITDLYNSGAGLNYPYKL